MLLEEGSADITCTIGSLPLPRGRYFVWVATTDPAGADLTPWHPVTNFEVLGAELDPTLPGVMRPSPVYVDATWADMNGAFTTAVQGRSAGEI
jgi:hypothetical protein